jgi:hypothetical protein
VSFNYDLVLDRAVEVASNREWQAQDGYGFEFPYFTVDGENECSTVHLPKAKPGVRIFKPHGSLNWLRRRRSNALLAGGGDDVGGMVLPLSGDLGLRYWASSDPFQLELLIAPAIAGQASHHAAGPRR